AVSWTRTRLSSSRDVGSRCRSVCSCGLRKAKLDRNTRPGHPWLSLPGIWVSASELYGYGPNHLEKLSMAFAALSATACASCAGEGGGGVSVMGTEGLEIVSGTPGGAGDTITSCRALGNDFSTPLVP